MPAKAIDELEITHARRRRVVCGVAVQPEGIENIGAEAGHRGAARDQVPVEPVEHRPMLDDGLLRERPPVSAGSFARLPVSVGVLGVGQPQFVHRDLYTESCPPLNLRSLRDAFCSQMEGRSA